MLRSEYEAYRFESVKKILKLFQCVATSLNRNYRHAVQLSSLT